MNLSDQLLRLGYVELMLDRRTNIPVKYWIDKIEALRDLENHKGNRYWLMFVITIVTARLDKLIILWVKSVDKGGLRYISNKKIAEDTYNDNYLL